MKQSLTADAIVTPEAADAAAMLEAASVVYFGNDWFAENRTSSHHIARFLGERFPVLYVETPGMRAPAATKRDMTKLWRKLRRAVSPPKQVGSHIWVMTIPQIPFRRAPFVERLNGWYARSAVRHAMRRLGIRHPILWFVVPHPGHLVGRLNEKYVVYYCIDDYSGLPDVDQQRIGRMDEDLTRAADQMFVASTTLIERKKKLNSTTEYSPHGVDFAHFNKASDTKLPPADAVRGLRHPVIGFFGSISGWIDIELIKTLATERPEWTFLLIGLATTDVTPLAALTNVVLAGVQTYDALPEWARAFDVAILPYKRFNQGAMNANPLKLREYLATGKPVVAVSTPEIDRFAHCIRIANTPEEFLREIEAALTQDSEADKQARLNEVAQSTWQARAAKVLDVVAHGMARKAKAAGLVQRQAAGR